MLTGWRFNKARVLVLVAPPCASPTPVTFAALLLLRTRVTRDDNGAVEAVCRRGRGPPPKANEEPYIPW